jgi:hypothetical protein
MKLTLKEKKIQEIESDSDEQLPTHRFNAAELDTRVEELSRKMHDLAIPLQEKVPEQVAQKFFSKYGKASEALKISKHVDDQGLVRIADIFIVAKIHDNIDLSWMLKKYNK